MHLFSAIALLIFWQNCICSNAITEVQKAALFQEKSKCRNSTYETREVYAGWPYRIECDKPVLFDYDDPTPVTCLVWDLDRKKLLFNVSSDPYYLYENEFFFDVTANGSVNFEVQILNSSTECSTGHIVHLNVTEHIPRTCQQDVANNVSHVTGKADLHKPTRFYCNIADSAIHLHNEKHDYNITWLRNCADLGNLSVMGHSNTKNQMLQVPSMTFDHAGIYTCAVSYNGITVYLTHFKICVKPKHFQGQHTVKCSKSVRHVTLGKTVTLECRSSFPGNLNKFQLDTKWIKLSPHNESVAVASCRDKNKTRGDGDLPARMSCSWNITDNCFHHVASKDERESYSAEVVMTLTISNIQESDLGRYMIIVDSTLTKSEIANATVILKMDRVPILQGKTVIVIACLSALAAILILMCLVWWKRDYLHVYYKRYFGAFEVDDRKYGAYLSYHYSTELDTYAETQIRGLCSNIHRVIEGLGYRVYDENRDGGLSQLRFENSLNAMRQCHRVVVVITQSYLSDQWSLSCLQRSVQTMIDTKTKIIFVLVPGMREYLAQHAATDETYRMIKRAMQLNYVIPWTHERNFNKKLFKLRIETAMPKIRSQTHVRHESTTSSTLLSPRYTNGVQRTMSMDTEVTEAGSPGPAGEQASQFIISTQTTSVPV